MAARRKNSWVLWLSQTKEELLRVLGLQEEEGSSLEFLRRGYKVTFLPIDFLPLKLSLSQDTAIFTFCFLQYRVPPGGKKILILNYLQHGVIEKKQQKVAAV